MARRHKPKNSGPNFDPDNFQPPSGYTPGEGHHKHQKSFTSTRSAQHRGKKIKIKTTYRIEIDGEPLTLHTMVMDDGSVHCHGLPNYSFPSAVDLARSIIDASLLAPMFTNELGDGHGGNHANNHGGDDANDHENNHNAHGGGN